MRYAINSIRLLPEAANSLVDVEADIESVVQYRALKIPEYRNLMSCPGSASYYRVGNSGAASHCGGTVLAAVCGAVHSDAHMVRTILETIYVHGR